MARAFTAEWHHSDDVGECNACSAGQLGPVVNVHIGGLSFRLCNKHRIELIHKLDHLAPIQVRRA